MVIYLIKYFTGKLPTSKEVRQMLRGKQGNLADTSIDCTAWTIATVHCNPSGCLILLPPWSAIHFPKLQLHDVINIILSTSHYCLYILQKTLPYEKLNLY